MHEVIQEFNKSVLRNCIHFSS